MDSEGEIYKIGSIYKRSKILKRWNKRSIVLNYVKGTLNLRKGKNAKEKVISLEDYEVVWVGLPKKTKVFYFSIKAIKNVSSQLYKKINIGDIDEVNARIWMGEIEKIIDKKQNRHQQNNSAINNGVNNNGVASRTNPNGVSTAAAAATVTLEKNSAGLVAPSEQQHNKSKPMKQLSGFLEVPSSASKTRHVEDMKQSSRQIVSVSKGEDYDEILKQFESCCQYNEEESSEYDERMPFERAVYVPDFNLRVNTFFMPDTILDNPGIDEFTQNAPNAIKAEVNNVLEAYYKKPRSFLKNLMDSSVFKDIGNGLYASLKDNNTHLIHLNIPDMKPIEVYEEIQTPSTNEHWNAMIQNYQFEPADHLNIKNLTQLSFNFKFDSGPNQTSTNTNSNNNLKEIFAYRYSFQFTDAYFIWEFQELGSDSEVTKLLKNRMCNSIVIIPDFNNELGCHLVIKSQLSFDKESPEQQTMNLQRFLSSFSAVKKCAASSNKESNNIIIECNEDQEDGVGSDDIDSGEFFSVRIDKQVSCGNAEDIFSSSEVDLILVKTEKNLHIEECIRSKHEGRIVKGNYELVRTNKVNGHYCFKHDYKRDEKKGGMLYLNEKLMKEQRTVIMSIVKRIGSNLLNGRSIMNISMPVQVFDSKTMMQRLARGFGHAPNFLERAAQSTSVVEQIKLSASFLLASFIMSIGQEKPFNPVIGETVQARLNGCPIYFEQTSHHPAISHYYLYGRGYDLYGCHIPLVNMSANSLQGQVQGGPTIHLKNSNTKIYAIWSNFSLYNIVFGQRMLNVIGRAYIFEPKNNLVLELIYNPNNTKGIGSLFSKRYAIDEVSGALYKVHPSVIQSLMQAHKPMASKSDLSIDVNKDVLQLISKAEGIWCKHLDFDGVRYWDDNKDFPYVCEYETTPLPSDSKFRKDMLYFQKNQRTESQNHKEEMENAQRHDAKLRENHKKKSNKK